MAPARAPVGDNTGVIAVRPATGRRGRRSVVTVLMLAARFSFTTYLLSLVYSGIAALVSIAMLVLALDGSSAWSFEAVWVVCFAVQQSMSVPLACWKRRVLQRQREQGRSLVQLELATAFRASAESA